MAIKWLIGYLSVALHSSQSITPGLFLALSCLLDSFAVGLVIGPVLNLMFAAAIRLTIKE